MSDTSVVSEKGQVTLPKSVRDQLGIRPGSRLQFKVQADGELRVQVLGRGAGTLFGLLARPGEATRSLDDMDAAVTRSVKTRAGRGK